MNDIQEIGEYFESQGQVSAFDDILNEWQRQITLTKMIVKVASEMEKEEKNG